MQFEPVIQAGFAPEVQISLNPFEPVISNSPLPSIVRHLTGDLTVIRSITARTGEPGFARAVTLGRATAEIQTSLTRTEGAEMNLQKRSRKKIQKPRVSKYIHLWPELEFMPCLNHWPNRPDLYQPENSEVLQFLVESFGTSIEEADRIFHAAASKGVIKFNKATRLWSGRKGGPS